MSTPRDGERPQLRIATMLKGMAEKQLKEAQVLILIIPKFKMLIII
jgi:hypothetical protein